jgi:hypothetical protein
MGLIPTYYRSDQENSAMTKTHLCDDMTHGCPESEIALKDTVLLKNRPILGTEKYKSDNFSSVHAVFGLAPPLDGCYHSPSVLLSSIQSP